MFGKHTSFDSRGGFTLPIGVLAVAGLVLCGGGWLGHGAMERHAREEQESWLGMWTDPATGLMWRKKDNGAVVNWSEAVSYCKSLTTGDYTGWRVPEREEISGLWQHNHLKGGIALSTSAPYLWTAKVDGDDYGPGTTDAVVFFPYVTSLIDDRAGFGNMPLERRDYGRALCVHSPRR